MPRVSSAAHEGRSGELQSAIDATDVIGAWEWDIPRDMVSTDALVALLFGVDPSLARSGAPLDEFTDSIHPEDRPRIKALLHEAAHGGGFYIAEHRVFSADGVTRWVLARGHFERDASGSPLRARGIVIDLTRNRMRDDGQPGAAIPSGAHPLERAAASCIEARLAIDELNDGVLRQLVNILLLAIGKRVASAIRADRATRPH